MNDNELIAILRLQKTPNIGDITVKKLIRHCGSASAVFTYKVQQLLKVEGVGTWTLKHLQDTNYLRAAEKELRFIRKHQIEYTSILDEDYPSYLQHCPDAPLLLFKRGKINLGQRKIISIVGTRNMTGYGKSFCEQFIADIAPLNPIIISGFAYGIDICVQRAAVAHGLQTIGCLAHGLNRIYPKTHAKYIPAIEENGGFVTEFWSDSTPEREHFLQRNRIIAGMSEATVVVESAAKGGSLVTADIAHSYHRDVFAVPGRAGDTYSIGCNNLIKQQKAHLLTSAADLVYLLGWETQSEKTTVVQKQLFVELDDVERTIYAYLQQKGKRLLDSIALECQFPVFKVSATLLTMEMKGVVRPLPGKLFEAV